MTVPEHLWRFPTRQAIDTLARRFDLPDGPEMQDWEWEVADPDRIDEFLAAYESGELSDDERFSLMEILLQSFEDVPSPLAGNRAWARVLGHLERSIGLHAHSVWYWSDLESKGLDNSWRVTPFLREILERHPETFAP